MSPKAAFTGGKLNLKGGNAKKKHKKHKNKDKTTSMTNTPSSTHHGLVDPPPEEVPSKRRKLADEDGSYDGHRGNGSSTSSSRKSSGSDQDHDDDDDQDLTKAERKSLKFKRQQERKDLEKIASLSHRERVEQFNEKIGKLTEHNDIPRVSAAGNG